jgi:hypothetical protein
MYKQLFLKRPQFFQPNSLCNLSGPVEFGTLLRDILYKYFAAVDLEIHLSGKGWHILDQQ